MVVYILIFILLVVFVGYSFYKMRDRKAEPFPGHWHGLMMEEVAFYKALQPKEQTRFQKRTMQFLSEVYVDGVDLEVTDLDRILLAASAVIPVFGFKEWHYKNLSGILIYPDNFNEDYQFSDSSKERRISGVVGSGRLERQMIISKIALHHGFRNSRDKRNTAIHEFAHLIDKMDDRVDGVPEVLLQNVYTIPWLKMIHDEMEAINNNQSDIRAYGGTSQAEFFAVASEYFFERPKLMKRKHPKVYKMLNLCFGLKG